MVYLSKRYHRWTQHFNGVLCLINLGLYWKYSLDEFLFYAIVNAVCVLICVYNIKYNNSDDGIPN